MASILEVKDVCSGYGKIEVLHGVFVHVESMEIVCIIGPNGSGKSTLLKTIFGLIKPSKGMILFAAKDISLLELEERVKMGMAYIPQGKNIFPSLTVRENLEMGGTPLIEPPLIKKAIQEISGRFPILERRFKDKSRSSLGW